MNVLLIVLYAVWSFRIGANILSYIHLWFVKEYRFDRMWIHFHTKQGKRLLIIPFRLPPLLPKAIALVIVTICVELVILSALPYPVVIRFIVADISSFPLTALFVCLLKLPTVLYHAMRISQARIMLSQRKNLRVVGITGSYGKTSTKEFLATILSQKYSVLKTLASKNSAIGIAEAVVTYLKPTHEIFVVEMGAYKRGEIAGMADLVKPEIGIVTAINEQHQDLFGSIDTTMKAKYELIQGLVGRRIAIFNGDNEKTAEMARWAKRDRCTVWMYSTHGKNLASQGLALRSYSLVYASDISSGIHDVQFTVHFQTKKKTIRVSVMGEHQVSNIMAAISASLAAGMDFNAVSDAASTITAPAKTLQLVSGPHHSTLINDTFNNNPDAAVAAIKYLAQYIGKKGMVFQPMIELGSYAAGSHEAVGEAAGRVCDYIILTNNNFFESFVKGVHRSSPEKHVFVYSPKQAATFIQSYIAKDDAVLFKGKEAEFVLKQLHS